MVRALLMTALVAAAACGGRANEPQSPSGPPPPPPPPGPDAASPPPPVSCPTGQITIETCVVGGVPREDGQANVSCGTTCETTPPAQTADQSCQQLAPDRYRCTGYAP